MSWGIGNGRGMQGLALAVTVAATAACTDANEALVVLQAQAPEDGCVINSEPASLRLDRGTLDVAMDRPYGYTLFPLVRNNMTAEMFEGEINANRVMVTGAQIKLVPPPGVDIPFSDTCAAEFDAIGNAQIYPDTSQVMSLEVIRSCHASLVRDLFKAGRLNSSIAERIDFRVSLRVKGDHGGKRLLSDPFEYPIRVCYGCLQTGFDGPFAAFNFPQPVPACDRLTSNPYQGNTCRGLVAQDVGPVLCCALNNDPNQLQCPAAPGAGMSMP